MASFSHVCRDDRSTETWLCAVVLIEIHGIYSEDAMHIVIRRLAFGEKVACSLHECSVMLILPLIGN